MVSFQVFQGTIDTESIPEREKIPGGNEMKTNFTEKKTVPVPRWGRIIFVLAYVLLMALSIALGAVFSPKEKEIPVILANGEVITPPWYIAVDGEAVALVESKRAAEETIERVIEKYQGNQTEILDIEVLENTKAEQMEIRCGDAPPDILTVDEAEEKLTSGNHGESYLTVLTTTEEIEQEAIAFDEELKPEPNLYVGNTEIETEGKEGLKEITRKVVKENGQAVEAEVIEEEVVEEPVQQVVLTGTKNYDGYGGEDAPHRDEGVSVGSGQTYDILKTPIDTVRISSGFGTRWGRMHRGTDFALAEGSPVYAADAGTVYFAGNGGGYGNLVKIDHGNGMQTYYAHCSQLLVSSGQQVSRGETIALTGSTGNSTGPHLHFEVIINGSCVDPVDFLALE